MTIKINNVEITDCDIKAPIKEQIGQELDTLTFTVLSNSPIYEWTKYQSVEVKYDNSDGEKTLNFLLMEVETVRKGGKFLNTFTAIEPTKYLENLIIDGMAMTYDYGSLYLQFEKLLKKIEFQTGIAFYHDLDLYHDFLVSSDPLVYMPSQEFFWGGQNTAREILDDFLASIDRQIRVSNITFSTTITVSIVLDNPTKLNRKLANGIDDLISYGETIYVDGDKQVEGVRSIVDNVVVDEEINTLPCVLRSEKPVDDTADHIFITQEPIYDLKELWVSIENFNFTYVPNIGGGGNVSSGPMPAVRVDLVASGFVVEKAEYDIMSFTEQSKHLYYTRGKKNIRGFNDTFSLSWLHSTTIIEEVITHLDATYVLNCFNDSSLTSYPVLLAFKTEKTSSVIVDDITYSSLTYNIGSVNCGNLFYRAKYTTRTTLVYDNVKTISNSRLNKTRMLNSQNEKMVDEKRFDDFQQAYITRIGNQEMLVGLTKRIVADTTNYMTESLWNIGDYFGSASKWVVDSREYHFIENDLVQVEYHLSNGYNASAQSIKLRREKRTYDISDSNYIDRYILVNATVDFDLAFFSIANVPLSSKHILLQPVKYGKNRNYRRIGMVDNYSAGVYMTTVSNTKVNMNLPYADNEGCLNNITITLADFSSLVSDIMFIGNLINAPLATMPSGDSWKKEVINLTNFYKDPFERLVFIFITNN